jgi:hypothetical protein
MDRPRTGAARVWRALEAMMHDGEINHTRALELVRMVLRENAGKLYGL